MHGLAEMFLLLFGLNTCNIVCASVPFLAVDQCHLSDSDCIKHACQQALPIFTAGIPELGVEVLDELKVDTVIFSIGGLKSTFTNGRVKGLRNTVIDKVLWEHEKRKIDLRYHLNCTVKGHYTANGQLLFFPISGDGELHLKLRDFRVKVTINYDLEKDANGEDHIVFKDNQYVFEIGDIPYIGLTNLFNGNKQLSEPILVFMNENWRLFTDDFGRPITEAITKKLVENINRFFSKVPLKDLAIIN